MKMRNAVLAIGSSLTMISDNHRLTLPIPTMRDGRLLVVRLIYTARISPDGALLTEPELIAAADYETGQFLSVERMDPKRLSLQAQSGGASKYAFPRFSSPLEMLNTYSRYYELHDILLPVMRGGKGDVDATARAAARDLLEIFEKLSEPPLAAYYDHFGGDFYRWLKRVTWQRP